MMRLARGVWRYPTARLANVDAGAAGAGAGAGSVVVKAVNFARDRATAAAAERELRVLHALCISGRAPDEDGCFFLVRCLGVELDRESATLRVCARMPPLSQCLY